MPSSLTCCCLVAKLCPTIATPWTVAHQAPLSMDFPGKNTGVGCHFLLQGIFSTQGLSLCLLRLLHWQADSLSLGHLGSPSMLSTCVLCRSFSSDQFSCSVMSDSLRPHELQHARPPCPSPTPRVHPNPCPLSW